MKLVLTAFFCVAIFVSCSAQDINVNNCKKWIQLTSSSTCNTIAIICKASIQTVKQKLFVYYFNAGLIRLLGRIKISLLLKIQWKMYEMLYEKIVYKHNMTGRECLKVEGHSYKLRTGFIKQRSIKSCKIMIDVYYDAN